VLLPTTMALASIVVSIVALSDGQAPISRPINEENQQEKSRKYEKSRRYENVMLENVKNPVGKYLKANCSVWL
jgi:hypothetical protein